MTIYQITQTEQQLVIRLYNKTKRPIAAICLAICALLLWIIPLLLFILSLAYHWEYTVAMLLYTLMGLSAGFTMLKKLLWRTKGHEEIIIRPHYIIITSYPFLQRPYSRCYTFDRMAIAHLKPKKSAEGVTHKSRIYFHLDSGRVTSHTQLPQGAIEEIGQIIYRFLELQYYTYRR